MDSTTQLSEDLLNQIKDRLQAKNIIIYWDYRDKLTDEQIVNIIKGNMWDVHNEIWEHLTENSYTYELEQEHIQDALEYFETEITEELEALDPDFEFDAEELAYDLRDELIDLIVIDTNIKDLFNHTGSVPVRIEMLSNYDCINSHWFETSSGGGYSYKESYFGDMVDSLNLNPAKVKQMLVKHGIRAFGRYPNKPNRDGKEFISYDDFWIELENSSCPANLLCFVGTVDLSDLISKEGELQITKVTIPKGNNVGLFSSWQGGGSCIEAPLLKDITIDLVKSSKNGKGYKLTPDIRNTGNGYTIDEVYGVTSQFWGNELTLTTKVKEQK